MIPVGAAKHASRADTSSIRGGRLALVSLGPLLSVGASYAYANNCNWSEDATDFHLHGGNDFRYALNLDKFGHFFAGAFLADVNAAALRWAGVAEGKSYMYGSVMSAFIQAGFEIKDGFAPKWGFSTWDVFAGSMGSLYAYGRNHSRFLRDTQVKMSYARRTEVYWDRKGKDAHIISDYPNQTFWISFRIDSYLPGRVGDLWPDFLRVAAGLSVDEHTDGAGGGNRELFVGLDYEIGEIIRKPRFPLLGLVYELLGYIKLPAPAIRLTPTGKVYGLYW
jgi:hypothetical protein